MPKIAVHCPILCLDKYGYQYHHRTVIDNLSKFADKVYLVLSEPQTTYYETLIEPYPNVSFISNESTWTLDGNGELFFDLPKIINSKRAILEQIHADGMDCVLNIHINQYVPEPAMPLLRAQCAGMLENGEKYRWLYKRYQMNYVLCHADISVPWIINLQMEDHLVMTPDSVSDSRGNVHARIRAGDYRRFNKMAIVDCQFNVRIKDVIDKAGYTGNYSLLRGGVEKIPLNEFSEASLRNTYQIKVNKKRLSLDALDSYGNSIAQFDLEENLADTLLTSYQPKNILYRGYRVLQFLYQILFLRQK